jgi:replicative superfamily II helicase
MNIFTEYIENQRKTKASSNKPIIGNAYTTPSKEQRKKEKEKEDSLPLVLLQDYLENRLKKDKEIAPLLKISSDSRWSDPGLSRRYFFAARQILLKRAEANTIKEEEKLFVNWFYTIDDMIAFNPVKFESDVSEYEIDKNSLKNNIIGQIDPSKVIKKQMGEPKK